MKLNVEYAFEPDYLRLDFSPQAVREHFEDAADEDNPYSVEGYTDIELAIGAETMLGEDYTWMYCFDYMMNRIVEIIDQERNNNGGSAHTRP